VPRTLARRPIDFSLQKNALGIEVPRSGVLVGVGEEHGEAVMIMKPEKMEVFRFMLTQKINELHGEAEKTVSEMNTGKENFPDPNDRASLEADRNFELRIRDRERKLILKMREAIQRINEGTFGICEVCEGPISEKRLMARPVTTLCIECKTKEEKLEKLKGA